MKDYIIIGSGPAGLQLGHHMKEAGRDFVILERDSHAGSAFKKFPRHGMLISVNKVNTGTDDPELNLRMDWNSLLTDDPDLKFTKYTKKYFPKTENMVEYLKDFANKLELPIQYNTTVQKISKTTNQHNEEIFEVETNQGKLISRRLIIATGVSKPNIPNIPGIELAEPYTEMSVNPDDFTNQKVLIIGKGNSAFETADNLIETTSMIHVAGPSSLKLAWKTHFVGHLRAVNNNFLDTYQLKSQNAIVDGHIDRIVKHGDGYLVTIRFVRADEAKKTIYYDRVLNCAGFRFDESIFDSSAIPKLTHNNRFPEMSSAFESVNVPGLYFAGTLMQSRDYKKSTCGFIHGFRYSVRSLFRILEQRHHSFGWPEKRMPSEAIPLTQSIIERVNRTSGLWQQFAFLCDVVSVNETGTATHCEEVPLAYVADGEFGELGLNFRVTLEYGPHHDQIDPFDVNVRRISQSDSENASEGNYLHPVVRCYQGQELIGKHHITENLDNEWDDEEIHVRPLLKFVSQMMRAKSNQPIETSPVADLPVAMEGVI